VRLIGRKRQTGVIERCQHQRCGCNIVRPFACLSQLAEGFCRIDRRACHD